jgi:hypothetical protein
VEAHEGAWISRLDSKNQELYCIKDVKIPEKQSHLN